MREGFQPARHVWTGIGVGQLDDGRAMEDLALDRAALEGVPVRASRRPSRAPRSAFSVAGRPPVSSSRSLAHSTSSSAKRGLPADAVAKAPRVLRRHAELSEKLVELRRPERLESNADRPLRPRLEQLRARKAAHEQLHVLERRRQAGEQVEQRLFRPLDIVDDEDERPLARRGGQESPHRPGELLRGRHSAPIPRSRATCAVTSAASGSPRRKLSS